jgi:putative peptidoglycan lipid II flippase
MSKGGQKIARAAITVMAFFTLSRVLGVIRQMAIAAQFGTSGDLDAYLAAARIPETIFLIVAGGALGSAFIPAFADHLAKEDRPSAWRLASAAVNLVLIVMTATAVIVAILAPGLVQTLIAPGFDDEHQRLTTSLLQMMLLSPIIFGVSGIVMGTLNAHQHFALPALAPSLYNLAIIGGTLILGPTFGVRGVAIGVVAGSALHLLIQVPMLLRYGARYTPTLGLQDPSVREVGRLMAPRVLGTAIVQLNLVVNNSLASGMGEGAVSAINFAWLLMLLPQGLFAQAVGTAAFPTFAEQVARGEHDRMREALAGTLRAVFFLSIPATAGLLTLGRPLVGFLFERGAFDASSTTDVVWALSFFALGLVGHAGLEIIARAFYALHDTITPVLVGAGAMVLNLLLSLTLPILFEAQGWVKHGGLALANSIATLLETAVLMGLIGWRLRGLEGKRTAIAFAKSGLAALIMGGALIGWQALAADAAPILVGGAGIALGVAVYLGTALLLRTEELHALTNMLHQRD